MVNIDEVKRDRKKNIVMSIRTTQEISDFMKEHDIAPSLVFHKAIGELMGEDGDLIKSKEDLKLTGAGKIGGL